MKSTVRSLLVTLALVSTAAQADSPEVHRCKAYVQGRIDVLDAQMHKGDKSGEGRKLLHRRDRLRTQFKACDKNPDAYKKDI